MGEIKKSTKIKNIQFFFKFPIQFDLSEIKLLVYNPWQSFLYGANLYTSLSFIQNVKDKGTCK